MFNHLAVDTVNEDVRAAHTKLVAHTTKVTPSNNTLGFLPIEFFRVSMADLVDFDEVWQSGKSNLQDVISLDHRDHTTRRQPNLYPLVDSGAALSCVSRPFCDKYGLWLGNTDDANIVSVHNTEECVNQEVFLGARVQGVSREGCLRTSKIIFRLTVMDHMNHPVILGADITKLFRIDVLASTRQAVLFQGTDRETYCDLANWSDVSTNRRSHGYVNDSLLVASSSLQASLEEFKHLSPSIRRQRLRDIQDITTYFQPPSAYALTITTMANIESLPLPEGLQTVAEIWQCVADLPMDQPLYQHIWREYVHAGSVQDEWTASTTASGRNLGAHARRVIAQTWLEEQLVERLSSTQDVTLTRFLMFTRAMRAVQRVARYIWSRESTWTQVDWKRALREYYREDPASLEVFQAFTASLTLEQNGMIQELANYGNLEPLAECVISWAEQRMWNEADFLWWLAHTGADYQSGMRGNLSDSFTYHSESQTPSGGNRTVTIYCQTVGQVLRQYNSEGVVESAPFQFDCLSRMKNRP